MKIGIKIMLYNNLCKIKCLLYIYKKNGYNYRGSKEFNLLAIPLAGD